MAWGQSSDRAKNLRQTVTKVENPSGAGLERSGKGETQTANWLSNAEKYGEFVIWAQETKAAAYGYKLMAISMIIICLQIIGSLITSTND